MPIDELRAGGVKARRPRARAGEAKRSALYAAEHSASIECVMASVIRRVAFPITIGDLTWCRNMFRAWTDFSG